MWRYWEDRLLRAKALGLNTIQTYVPWNLHEPTTGTLNFEGIVDLVSYLKLCQKLGLYLMLRPGPYICGEWDLGGFPAWLLAIRPALRLRSSDPAFLESVTSVGISTEWGLLMASISEDTGEETPLQVRLNGVATFIGVVGVSVAFLVLVVLLISPGSCFFEPKGAHIYQKLMCFIKHQHRQRGYDEVITPNIYNLQLWDKCGQAEMYKEKMFALERVYPCKEDLDQRSISMRIAISRSFVLDYYGWLHAQLLHCRSVINDGASWCD